MYHANGLDARLRRAPPPPPPTPGPSPRGGEMMLSLPDLGGHPRLKREFVRPLDQRNHAFAHFLGMSG